LNGTMQTVVSGPVLANATTGCSPVSDIANPNATSGGNATGNEWLFASAQTTALGNSCASGGCIMNFIDEPWKASTAYAVGQEVLDTHLQIQVVSTLGTSKATAPAWKTTVGGVTADNNVRWLNQGPIAAFYASWAANTMYAAGAEIVDTNNNIQLVVTAGTSGAAHPTWNATVNKNTADHTVTWRNVGEIPTASQAAAGGASGIIMDNTVGSGTLPGASQIYYSTLSNQTCTTSGGNGGCAVQASQSALQ
jgi:hypothetical protein